MKWMYFILMILLFTGCKKEKTVKSFTIKGLVVESTSNPAPVSNYRLRIYQASSSGLLGGVSGFDENIHTGSDGRFTFKYNPYQNFGFSSGGSNPNDITLTGIDSLQYKDLYSYWTPIPALTDINVDTFYLYKKIKTIVRKIQFDNQLNDGENLEIITSNSPRYDYKTITGPIAAGTILTLDPILNCRITWYHLTNKQYSFSAVLKKPSYQKNLTILLSKEDEEYREVLMIY